MLAEEMLAEEIKNLVFEIEPSSNEKDVLVCILHEYVCRVVCAIWRSFLIQLTISL